MAGGTKKLIDVQEIAWTKAIPLMIGGASLFIVCFIALSIETFVAKYSSMLATTRIPLSIGMFAGLAIVAVSIYQAWSLRSTPALSQLCPYCNRINAFVEAPKVDYVCDHCQRTIHFQNGKAVPIKKVTCRACKTDHFVAETLDEYQCDNCNRMIEVSKERKPGYVDQADALLQNFDVLLVAVDRRKETEVAQKIQNMMMVNIVEAKKMISNATPNKPLIVERNQPQRKAEAIRRSLQDMGATVTLRPSTPTNPVAR